MMYLDEAQWNEDPKKKKGTKKPTNRPTTPPVGPIAPPVMPGSIPPAVIGGWQNQQGLGGMLNVGQRMSGQAMPGLLNFSQPGMYGSGPFFGNIAGGMDPRHMDQLINAQFMRSLRQPAQPWLPAPMNLAAFANGDDPTKKKSQTDMGMLR